MKTISKLVTTRGKANSRNHEHLLAHVLKKPREWVIAHHEAPVRPAMAAHYCRLLRRLAHDEPLPYLTGEHWFYGRPFTVNSHVLIPRPETELLVELALQHLSVIPTPTPPSLKLRRTGHSPSSRGGEKEGVSEPLIIDIGTGSGCIAVTLAAELPNTHIIATDASPAALRVARTNAQRHGVAQRISFVRGNLLKPALRVISRAQPEKSHIVYGVRSLTPTSVGARDDAMIIVLANLPYLTTAEWRALPRSIRAYEPRQALDGGPDGLKYYYELFAQLAELQARSCKLQALLEIDPRRKRALTALLNKYFPLIRSSSAASDERMGGRALPDPARGMSKRPVPREGCTAGNREVSCSQKTLPGWRAFWHRDLSGRYRVLSIQY